MSKLVSDQGSWVLHVRCTLPRAPEVHDPGGQRVGDHRRPGAYKGARGSMELKVLPDLSGYNFIFHVLAN